MNDDTEMGAARLMARVPGCVVRRYSLLLLVILGALFLGSAGGSAVALSSSSSPSLFAENINQLAQPAYIASFEGGLRHLLQTSNTSTSRDNLLATSRTDRPNPLHGLKKYRGGFNLSNKDYGASLGYTGLPAWILALIWAALGLFLLLTLCCCCCCCRHRTRHEYNHGRLGYILPILALILFTLAAIAGSVLLYYYSQKFNNELQNTLNYVVNQSQITEAGLREVQANLTAAVDVDLDGSLGLSPSAKTTIASLNQQLNSTANDLHDKTIDNRKKIKNGINIVRIVLIVVAGVMLALVLLGLLFAALGVRPLVYLLILLGWVLVLATWILCGIFIFLDNGIGDTCLAMREWVNNGPEGNTSLDRFLPCNGAAAGSALASSQGYSGQIVGYINSELDNVVNTNPPPNSQPNWYNQNGPLVPTLCNTTSCANNTVTFANAATVWNGSICSTDSSGFICTSVGRLTPVIYRNLTAAANAAGSLSNSGQFLANAANCTFVSDTFTNITQTRCHNLRLHSKWIWIGLILVSAGNMLSILLWIVFIRRKRYRYYQRKNQEKMPMYKGQSQPYSPTQPRATVSPAA